MEWVPRTSVLIANNNRVRSAATIAYCGIDTIVKVFIDRYLGQQPGSK